MAKRKGYQSPSRPTVKRLFAVSGNRCAFPKCETPLVDLQSGSIVGEICHIKGDKPGAARYDANQTDKERQAFENLLLLCNVHHKIVDDDEAAYSVERVTQMKADHEARHQIPPQVDQETVKQVVSVLVRGSSIGGSVITTHSQTGGQVAHSITNYYSPQSADEPVKLEGKLEQAGDLEMLAAFGCPGMRFTVVCRSARQAKIQATNLYVDGVDVMRGLQSGFGTDFGYTPLEGSTQTLYVKLLPLSRPNSPEGYVLDRDDVCRFFYPLPMPPTILTLQAQPEQVWIAVTFFDGTEETLLTGRDVQQVLKDVYEIHRERPGTCPNIRFGVTVKSKTRPNVDMMGKVNRNYVPMVKPDEPPSTDAERTE